MAFYQRLPTNRKDEGGRFEALNVADEGEVTKHELAQNFSL